MSGGAVNGSVSGGEVLVRAEQVALAYGDDAPALSIDRLTLKRGELVVLLGPNGGGKTTFFRALTGQLKPVSGSFEVDGAVAHLPQRDASRVDFPVSALDVVLMGTLAERRFWQRAGRPERLRALKALELVGLAEQCERTYGELSGGQRRRVLLARTIVSERPVVALDEPLSGVDPQSAAVIHQTLRSLRDAGRLVIEASHDIAHARSADRVVCMAGRVISEGPPQTTLTEATLAETYAGELALIPAADGSSVLAGGGGCGHEHEHEHEHEHAALEAQGEGI